MRRQIDRMFQIMGSTVLSIWTATEVLVLITAPDQQSWFLRLGTVLLVAIWSGIPWIVFTFWMMRRKKKRDDADTTDVNVTLALRCPICGVAQPLTEVSAHTQEHIDELTNPSHQSIPVSVLLRRPQDSDWHVITEEQ